MLTAEFAFESTTEERKESCFKLVFLWFSLKQIKSDWAKLIWPVFPLPQLLKIASAEAAACILQGMKARALSMASLTISHAVTTI